MCGCVWWHKALFNFRFDKYQKLTKYWYEEDLEVESLKERERVVEEEGEYEVDTNLPDSMDPGAPMAVDMDMAARGGIVT